jgi:TonB family protein
MDITSRDFIYSVLLHAGLLILITMLNPFAMRMARDFESVAVNIITMPPIGDPALIKASMPEITIPQATIDDEAIVPISKPESKTELKPVEKKETPKPKDKPRRDTGYKGQAAKAESTQAGGADVSDQIGPGTDFGSVAVDNANFQYPYYFVQAFGKIQRNWSNPVAANQPLSCIIYFKIIRSGTVLDSEIEKSSGVAAYDRACMRAIQSSSPLPPLPTDFRDDIIGIHLEFPYEP